MPRIIFTIIVLTSLTFCFISYGCKKKTISFQLEGSVYDATFKKGLSDCKIIVEGFSNTSGYELITELQADANGNFSLTLERNLYASIRFRTVKHLYFEGVGTLKVSDLDPENPNKVDISTTAMAWIDFRFINDNGQSSDTFSFRKQAGKTDCDGCCDTELQTFNGAVGGQIICLTNGNESFSYLYSSTGNSAEIASVSSIAMDTLKVAIHY